MKWFAIRVSYGRVLKVCAMLREDGVECFVPMCTRKVEKDGRKQTVTVPAVSNLGFVRTTRAFLEEFFLSMGGFFDDYMTHGTHFERTGNTTIAPDIDFSTLE